MDLSPSLETGMGFLFKVGEEMKYLSALFFVLFFSTPVFAELIYFTNGAQLDVTNIEEAGNNAKLTLPDGKIIYYDKSQLKSDLSLIISWVNIRTSWVMEFDDGSLKKGQQVKVMEDERHGSVTVLYKNDKNEILDAETNKYYLISEDEYQKKETERQKELKEIEKEAEKEAQERHEQMKAFPVDVQNKIKRGDIWLGMSQEMAILSRGKPRKINRTVNPGGVYEQWIYDIPITYLYFKNDILTSWQD